jgi:beta-glucosidase
LFCAQAFGSGSSYTTFTCSQGSLTGSIENGFEVIATVTNTGSRAGREVIQVYVSKPSSLEQDEATTPVKTLEGFTKTSLLLPNSSETVSVALPTRAFASWSVQEHGWQVQAGRHKVLIARDAEQIFVEFGVDVKARMVVA